LLIRFCLHGIENASRVNEGRSSVHGHSDAERFDNLLFRRPVFQCSLRMNDDTAITVDCDRNRQRNELADFRIKQIRLIARVTERAITTDNIGLV